MSRRRQTTNSFITVALLLVALFLLHAKFHAAVPESGILLFSVLVVAGCFLSVPQALFLSLAVFWLINWQPTLLSPEAALFVLLPPIVSFARQLFEWRPLSSALVLASAALVLWYGIVGGAAALTRPLSVAGGLLLGFIAAAVALRLLSWTYVSAAD